MDDDELTLAPLDDDRPPRKAEPKQPDAAADKPVKKKRSSSRHRRRKLSQQSTTDAADAQPPEQMRQPQTDRWLNPVSRRKAESGTVSSAATWLEDLAAAPPPLTDVPVRHARGKNWWLPWAAGTSMLAVGMTLALTSWISRDRAPPIDLFAWGEETYARGEFDQALANYQAWLDSNVPAAERSALARPAALLRAGISRLALSAAVNSQQSLADAELLLTAPGVQDPAGDDERRLHELLENLADRTVREYEAASDATDVDREGLRQRALAALGLRDSFIATRLHLRPKFIDLKVRIDAADRGHHQATALQNVLAAKDVAGTSAAWEKLFREYPAAAVRPELEALRNAWTNARAQMVRFEQAKSAPPGRPDRPAEQQIVLGPARGGGEAPRGTPVLVKVPSGAAVYGIDSATGEILWRRGTRLDSGQAWTDAINEHRTLIPAGDDGLACLTNSDGLVNWEAHVGPLVAPPVIVQGQVLVPLADGSLAMLDAQTGAMIGHWALPARPAGSPGVAQRSQIAWQLCDDGVLYSLDLESQSCVGALWTGLGDSASPVAPAQVGNFLAVVANDQGRASLLAWFALDPHGKPSRHMGLVRLPGQVWRPTVATQSELTVACQGGTVCHFRAGADGDMPQRLADMSLAGGSEAATGAIRFGERSMAWGWGLRWWDGAWPTQPNSLAVVLPRDPIDQVLTYRADQLVVTADLHAVEGTTAVGLDAVRGNLQWSTHLGAIPRGGVQKDDAARALLVVHASGNIYVLAYDQLGTTDLVLKPSYGQALDPWLPDDSLALEFPDKTVVHSPGAGHDWYAVQTNHPQPQLGRHELAAALACQPIAVGAGLLVPFEDGSMAWLDPATAQPLLTAYLPVRNQPRLRWRRLVWADNRSAWAESSDGSRYRVIIDPGANQVQLESKSSPSPRERELVRGRSHAETPSEENSRDTQAPAINTPSGERLVGPPLAVEGWHVGLAVDGALLVWPVGRSAP